MKRTLIVLAAFALLSAAGTAAAAEMTGKVKQANNAADTLTLEDGTLFYLGEGASMKGLKPGMTVVVTYEVVAGLRIASRIVAK